MTIYCKIRFFVVVVVFGEIIFPKIYENKNKRFAKRVS